MGSRGRLVLDGRDRLAVYQARGVASCYVNATGDNSVGAVDRDVRRRTNCGGQKHCIWLHHSGPDAAG